MYYLDCRMLQGSGISTYLMGLIRIYQKNYIKKNLNYLVREYTRVITNAPEYLNQYRFQNNIAVYILYLNHFHAETFLTLLLRL